MIKRITKKFFFNKIIWFLTASDVFTWGLYTVMSGLTGIYIAQKIDADIVQTVGIGLACYTITRGLLQIPIGLVTDLLKTNKDEIFLLILGNILMGIPFIFLPFITSQSVYYFIQIILGIGAAINLISWRKLFANHLDKGKEGLEYGAYDTTISLATALFGAVIGFVASINEHYFDLVVFTVGFIMANSWIWGVMILFSKYNDSNKD